MVCASEGLWFRNESDLCLCKGTSLIGHLKPFVYINLSW